MVGGAHQGESIFTHDFGNGADCSRSAGTGIEQTVRLSIDSDNSVVDVCRGYISDWSVRMIDDRAPLVASRNKNKILHVPVHGIHAAGHVILPIEPSGWYCFVHAFNS